MNPDIVRRPYPEVQLGRVFLALIVLVVPLHGSRHSIMLMLPLLLLDLHTQQSRNPSKRFYQKKPQTCFKAFLFDLTSQQQAVPCDQVIGGYKLVDRQMDSSQGKDVMDGGGDRFTRVADGRYGEHAQGW